MSRQKFTIAIALTLVVALSACAPAPTAPTARTAAGVPPATATLRPSVTPTPIPLPSSTATRASTTVPTRTLSPAEARTAQLRALAGYTWQARDDAITLTDAKGAAVATLDTDAGRMNWTGDFASTLNPLLSTDAGRQAVAAFIKANEAQGIHFLAYPDSRPNKAPYAVILSPDGKEIKIIQGFTGTKNYTYDSQAKRLNAIAPDNQSYSFFNPQTGKFEYDEKAIDKYVDNISINFPDAGQTAKVRQAVKWAFTHIPDVTPDQLNDLMGVRNGQTFRDYFNATWGTKYNLDFDSLIIEYMAQMQPGSYPTHQLSEIRTIDTSRNPTCPMTCVRTLQKNLFQIEVNSKDIEYIMLESLMLKEFFAGNLLIDTYYHKNVRGNAGSDAGTMAEMLSFAIQSYTFQMHVGQKDVVQNLIDSTWKGGFVIKK